MNPDGPQSNEDFMEGLLTPTEIIPAGESETMTNHAKPFWKRLDYGKILLGFPKQRWILLVGDLLLIALAHYVSLWIRFGFPIDPAAWAIAFAVTLLCYPPALYIFDLYNISRLFSWYEIAYRSALAVIGAETISAIVLYLLPQETYGRGVMAIQLVLCWVLLNGWRNGYRFLFQSSMPRIPVIIVGAGDSGHGAFELLRSPFSPYEVKAFVDDDPSKHGTRRSPAVLGASDQLRAIARQTGAMLAILAIPRNRSPRLIANILDARLHGMEILQLGDVFERLTGRIPVQHIADQWLLFAQGFYLLQKGYIQRFKRLADFAFSGLLLLLAAPVIGLTALAVCCDSPGPVFYRQKRVGHNRNIFTMYKFRSMSHNAETDGARWAAEEDPRVTRVGKWLRLTHIDELPQIWNIFKGDMSLVGPRPERPEFVEMLEQEVPYYFVRHSVQPGLTGWAQVNYQYGASVEDGLHKLEYDLYYVKNMSIFLDLKILLKTIGVVLLREGSR